MGTIEERLKANHQEREYQWLNIWRMTANNEEENEIDDSRLTRFFLWIDEKLDPITNWIREVLH